MSNLTDPIVKEIINARVHLLFKKPFFGHIASRLKLVDATSWLPTAATDGRHLFYNREFIKKLSRDELAFLVGHEVLHAVYDHIGRRGTRDPQIWNMATDYIINYTLVDAAVGSMIKGGLYDKQYHDGLTADEVYKLLQKNSVKIQMPLDEHLDSQKDSGGNGKSKGSGQGQGSVTVMGDGDGPPTLTEEELDEIRSSMKDAVISAAQSVGAGNVPAGVQRLIQDLTEPKLDWREMLDAHIKSYIKDDYSFNRIAKRSWSISKQAGKRLMLPGAKDQETIDVVCTIDTSGSMGENMLRDFLSEVKGIMQEFQDFKLQLFTFDTKVYGHVVFTPDNIDEIDTYEMKGGGGTMFECAFDFMKENEIDPHRLIFFTDGYPCGSWGPEDYCDTLFIIHSGRQIVAPYGLTVHYD